MRMSIGKRLFLCFFLLAVMEGGLVFFGFRNLGRMALHSQEEAAVAQELEFVYEVMLGISGLMVPVDDYLIHGHTKEKEIFWRRLKECQEHLRRKGEIYGKTAMPGVVQKAEIAVAGIEERARKVFADDASISREERVVVMEEADDIIAEAMRFLYAYHKEHLDKRLTAKVAEGGLLIRRTRFVTGCIFSLIILFSVVMGFLLARGVLVPVRILKESFRRVARGGQMEVVEIRSRDEFEELASDFNRMIARLKDTLVSKNYFNQIIQNMSDILFVVNPYGGVEFINKRVCELLGYTESELKGKDAISLFSKKDRYAITWGLKGLIEDGAFKDKRVFLQTKSGREFEVYLGMRLLKDSMNNVAGLVCLAKDLTEINKLLDEVIRSNAEITRHRQELERSVKELTEYKNVILSILEDTNESKDALTETLAKLRHTQDELVQVEKLASLGQIAAGVAHEINNPLFVISGETEMLVMEEALSPAARESLATIREQINRVTEIIRRLLEFSRKRESKPASIDIRVLLEKTIALLKYQAKAMGRIEVEARLGDEDIIVFGDQVQLQEVFLNIMLNAVQAMEEKGGTLTIRTSSEIITSQGRRADDKFRGGDKVACVDIADTGTGIDAQTQKRIFDPFFTTKKTGTGLGLSVCLGIVENHGGSISVESVVGQGTTFKVRFPLVRKDQAGGGD